MNLIEQLGGYDEAKNHRDYLIDFGNEFNRPNKHEVDSLNDALLEYRREHGIFEVGDKVISINSAFIKYQGVLNIDFIDRFNLMLSGDRKGFDVNAICGWTNIVRHATPSEIGAGKRLN